MLLATCGALRAPQAGKAKADAEAARTARMNSRLLRLMLLRGLKTWVFVWEDDKHRLELKRTPILRLKKPPEARAMNSWVHVHQGGVEARRLVTLAFGRWRSSALASGLGGFAAFREERMRAAAAKSAAMRFAMRLQQPAVVASFDEWRKLSATAVRSDNPCEALLRSVRLATQRCTWFCRECMDVGEPERMPR
jgi:hypothetical protein